MNNGTNPIRAKHLESTANVAKNFLAAQISDVTAAISSDLVNVSGMTLSTTQPTVNGALWFSSSTVNPSCEFITAGTITRSKEATI